MTERIPIFSKNLSELVRRLLDERGMSDRELGRRAGLSSSMISERMRGTTRWTFDDLFAVSNALGISVNQVVTELEKLVPPSSSTDTESH